MSRATRRQFLQTSTAAGASLLLTGNSIVSGKGGGVSGKGISGKAVGANDRLRIAVAGLNGRGRSHMQGWLEQKNVEIAYLIDPDRTVLTSALSTLKKKTQGKFTTQGVVDVRAALDDKNLDAISVATPNHWHSLITIWAAQAGKHVYVEKPMSHDVAEGRAVVAAQKKYGVVIQHGTQKRSNASIAGLHKAIQAGKFGKLKISYGYCCKPRGGIGFKQPTNPPDNLAWRIWRGPAMVEQYHANLVPYNWHWFWKTGNGDMNNQGTHELDVARWALDTDQTFPVRAMAMGGRFMWHDQGETPNTMFGIAEYPNGQFCYFNVRNVNYEGYQRQVENEYYFEDGGKIIRGEYYAKGSQKGEKIELPDGDVTPGGNWGSFIAACRAGDPSMANGTALDAHYSCVLGHLMNNSYRLGKQIPFNAKAGNFGDNPDAHEHFMKLHEIMKQGVGVPADSEHYTVGPWLTFDPATEKHTGDHAAEANVLLKDPHTVGFPVPDADKV